MESAFSLKVSPEGIGELVFDLKGEKVNKFSIPVLEDLERHLEKLAQNKSIKILALKSAKDSIFIAGADLHSFEPAFEDPPIAAKIIDTGHRVFDKLNALPFPTVAIIDGACLGGGLECALSCTYRIVSDNPKTSLALPEVNLGIFPGWGGTQRLPRLVGLENGLGMVLAGRGVNAMKAWKMGLADAIVPAQFLEQKSEEFLKSVLTAKGQEKIKQRRKRKTFRQRLLESNPLGRSLIFKKAKEQILEKTKGRYPAPLLALHVVEETFTLPLEKGLKREAEEFKSNIPQGFSQAKYLISLFFVQEALKKDPGVKGDIKPKSIENAAILGAGTMGATLAWLFSNSNIRTRIKDISWDLVGKGYAVAKSLYDKGVKIRKVAPWEAERKFNLLSSTIDYSGFQHEDIVIEAAVENLDLKKKIFKELEEKIPEDALIASNTSSLTIEAMSEGMAHPERFIGMHFFNPPNKMPLVEIVAGPKSSDEAIVSAVSLSKRLGKTPIVVKDCPGFLVNRIFVLGANEVLYMLQEGIPQDLITKEILGYGMPMDPFLLADEVGNDVAFKVTKSFEQAYGERMRGPRLLELMYEAKLYGKKNGKGFYIYKGESRSSNPEIQALLKKIEKPKGAPSSDEIIPRFTSIMINEAARCLEEGIINNPSYLDMALIMGIGFPPYRGGLLKYADEKGIDKVVRELEEFQGKYGMRFKPANLLVEMRNNSKKFYDPLSRGSPEAKLQSAIAH